MDFSDVRVQSGEGWKSVATLITGWHQAVVKILEFSRHLVRFSFHDGLALLDINLLPFNWRRQLEGERTSELYNTDAILNMLDSDNLVAVLEVLNVETK